MLFMFCKTKYCQNIKHFLSKVLLTPETQVFEFSFYKKKKSFSECT